MYSVGILKQAIKDIAGLPQNYAKLVSEHIDRLAQDPRPANAKKLQGSDIYSLRVGVYRILYEINDIDQIGTVFRVKHRKDAYRP